MKFIITESQYNKTKQMILNSFEEVGVIKTIKKFKLSPEALDKLFTGGLSEIEKFDESGRCSVLEDLIFVFFRINYFGNYTLDYEGEPMYSFSFGNDNHTGALIVSIEDLNYGDTITVYATPFYEGYCEVPIDVYQYDDTNGVTHDPEDLTQYEHKVSPKDFNSFTDLSNWFKNEYPKILLKFLEPDWSKFRQENDNQNF
jgi:hypothetical protein